MVVYHQRVRAVIQAFFAQSQQSQETFFPFLLINGPKYVGKTALLDETIREYVGEFVVQDYRPLYDLSTALDKNHVFQVEVPENEQYVKDGDTIHYNLGARDVARRLSISPVGSCKIVLIEEIERMSISAANALLKTFEEPLPGRIIVATTTHKERLLDTILSRAWVVDMQPLSDEDVLHRLQAQNTALTPEMQAFILAFSMGRLRLAQEMIAWPQSDLEVMAKHFAGLTQPTKLLLSSLTEHTNYFIAQDYREQVGEARNHYAAHQHDFETVHTLLNAWRVMRQPIKKEHIAFDIAMQQVLR